MLLFIFIFFFWRGKKGPLPFPGFQFGRRVPWNEKKGPHGMHVAQSCKMKIKHTDCSHMTSSTMRCIKAKTSGARFWGDIFHPFLTTFMTNPGDEVINAPALRVQQVDLKTVQEAAHAHWGFPKLLRQQEAIRRQRVAVPSGLPS